MRKSHDRLHRKKRERKEWNHIQETSVLIFDLRNLKEASFEKSATDILTKLVAWAGIHIIPRSRFQSRKGIDNL
jgi:hypothetical protein